jgi:hypothetical protein
MGAIQSIRDASQVIRVLRIHAGASAAGPVPWVVGYPR